MSISFIELRNKYRLDIAKCLSKLKIGNHIDICDLIYNILEDLYENKYIMNKIILDQTLSWKPSLDIILDEYRLTPLLRGSAIKNGVNWHSWLNECIVIDILAKIANCPHLLSQANYGFMPFHLNNNESCYICCRGISKKRQQIDFNLNRCKKCASEFTRDMNYNHFCWWCKCYEGHYIDCIAMTIIYSS